MLLTAAWIALWKLACAHCDDITQKCYHHITTIRGQHSSIFAFNTLEIAQTPEHHPPDFPV